MSKLFTTEGVSGHAISELSCETVMGIGRALAMILQNRSGKRAKILIGRDTRLSGEILCAAFAAGCCSAGADVHVLGVIPTPAVSYLSERYSADAGVMISACHNGYEYNGIRIFGEHGYSLSDELWSEIERLVTRAPGEMKCSGGENIGKIVYEKNAEWDYVRALIKQIDADLGRMRVAIDCGNGAASTAAEKFYRGIGANIVLINNAPDGRNINKNCGTVDLAALSQCVIDNRCQVGIAFDGDAGRCLMVDEKGNALDGDRITSVLAYAMKKEERLNANTCVVSPTTNLGFFRWAKEQGIVVSQAPEAGIRYLEERMLLGEYNLAGSASGHIVLHGPSKTADGMLAGAKILEILALSHKKMSELVSMYEPYPRVAINVTIRPEYVGRWQNVPTLSEMITYCQQKLEGDGRVFVRESTTSPVLRISAEGRDKDTVWQYAQTIAKIAKDYVGMEETE